MATEPERLEAAPRPLVTIRLQPAHREDANLALAWRNDPALWARSGTGRPVTPAEHARWWDEHAMDATRCRLWLVKVGGLVSGMVRFDRVETAAMVSLYIAEAMRGRGIGARAFLSAWSHRPSWAETAEALVRIDNPDAQAFFGRLGFQELARNDELIRYRRTDDAA